MKKVKTIDINEIQIGEINNSTLVEWFGSDANKNVYKLKKKIDNGLKTTLLKRAACKCEIQDLGRGKYNIKKVYTDEIPYEIYSIKTGLNKYLAQMILSQLMTNSYLSEDKAHISTVFNFAESIEFINKHYQDIKYKKTAASDKLGINIEALFDYYKYTDSSIKYYLTITLENLRKAGIIRYDEPYMVVTRTKIDEFHTLEEAKVKYVYSSRVATIPEVAEYFRILNNLKSELFITDNRQMYFGSKSSEFKKRLQEELNLLGDENNKFLLFFKGYRIWCISENQAESVLSNYLNEDTDKLIESFKNEFIQVTIKNMKNRQQKKDIIQPEEATFKDAQAKKRELMEKLDMVLDTGKKQIEIDYEILTKITIDYFEEELGLMKNPAVRVIRNGNMEEYTYLEEEINIEDSFLELEGEDE